MVEFVLYNVILDFIAVKEVLEIVHLHVILLIFLIPQKDIQEELVLQFVFKVFQIMKVEIQLIQE